MPLVFQPSANIARLKESATLAVAAKARALKAAGQPIIDLGAGEPDFDTPAFIRHAAAAAMEAGATRYTATEGILPLREAIAADANRLLASGAPITAAEVVVSTGSKQSLYNACVCCFGPGDEVLIPTPAWTSYYEMVELARAVSVPVFGDEANDLKVTAAQLAAAATPRTKGLMLNSPSNPTGAVYTRDELTAILDLAADKGWWVLADEIYRRIAYEGGAQSALEVATTRENLIVINGVAKAYAMTGWRLGWIVAPRTIAADLGKLIEFNTSCAPAFVQAGALQALAEDPYQFKERRAALQARAGELLAGLKHFPGLLVPPPTGGMYVFLRIRGEQDSVAIALRLIDEAGLGLAPGSAFGAAGEGADAHRHRPGRARGAARGARRQARA